MSNTALGDVAGGWITEEIRIADRTLLFTRPGEPDALLDDADVLRRHAHDGYMPYWGRLWTSAWDMADAVFRATWSPESRVLELGAGVGLVGLAACARGMRVTFSDYDPLAVDLCRHNARQNGFEADGLVLDWNQPTAGQFPIILGCEVLYEAANLPLVLGVVKAMLAPGGFCWLGDPGRMACADLPRHAAEFGFECRQTALQPTHRDARYAQTNLYELRRVTV